MSNKLRVIKPLSVGDTGTFSRAGTGTYFDSAGVMQTAAINVPRRSYDPANLSIAPKTLIEEARTNLLTYSGDLITGTNWQSGATLSNLFVPSLDSSMAGPDGTMGVAKFVTGTTTSQGLFLRKNTLALTAGTYSAATYIYVPTQAGVTNWGLSNDYQDVESGTSGAQTVFDCWVRVSTVATLAATRSHLDYNILRNGVPPTNGDGFTFYAACPQLEAGSFPTSYIPSNDTFTSRASTATYIGSDGLLKTAAINEARMQYNPLNLSLAPKLLLEAAGTNLAINSEVLSIGDGVSISADTAVSPSGATTADAMYEAATTGEHYCYDASFAPTIGETYTWSAFVKKGNGTRNVYMRIAGGNIAGCVFDTTAEIITPATGVNAVSSAIVRLLNGWFRVSITFKATSSSTTVCRTQLITSAGATIYLGDTANFNYIWGRQLETGSYPTSYIPTTTTAIPRSADVSTSTATPRAADVITGSGLAYSSVPETDYADWSATTAYALAERVVRTTTHKIYESLIANTAAEVVTLTIAAPCVVTLADHGFTAGTAIKFSTTGALPTGLVAGTVYYVLTPAASTFNVAETVGGAAITTTGTQSGAHSVEGLLNYNKTPETDATNWLEIGPTNRWKMFDNRNSTQTVRAGSIVVILAPGQVVNSMALLNVVADTVQVEVVDPVDGSVYDQTFDMQAPPDESSWYSYFFDSIQRGTRVTITDMPSYGSAYIVVTLTVATGNAACGVLLIGTVRQIGAFGIEYGARVGVQDYSRKERDLFGNYSYVKRANSKKFNVSMLINNSDLDAANQFLSELDGPVVWIGSDTYDSLVVYGFAKDYGTTISYPQYSQFTLDVEGLT